MRNLTSSILTAIFLEILLGILLGFSGCSAKTEYIYLKPEYPELPELPKMQNYNFKVFESKTDIYFILSENDAKILATNIILYKNHIETLARIFESFRKLNKNTKDLK